ncbi:hypothetical protein PRUB_a2664 [Pseudoalteromonas rubra]|uniref:Uncharacterized protein n=1 Tax=Pseudoalteromonas rubra TaxID=43658 RepID=A0A8T0CBM4_9GAMM|nr:hypothetical protein PRUB_a2664 [Pseudoalteromonas rubra]
MVFEGLIVRKLRPFAYEIGVSLFKQGLNLFHSVWGMIFFYLNIYIFY